MPRLWEELSQYEKRIKARFHMPGHHGELASPYDFLAKWDITEVPGYDNLRDPRELLLREEKRLASFFGAKNSFLSVNGATSLLMAAITYLSGKNKRALVPREAHISIYNALFLRGIEPIYYGSELEETWGVSLGASITSFHDALKKSGNQCDFCILNSPTYLGFCGKTEEMISLSHEYGLKVLIDEAHGAHFSLMDQIPPSGIFMNGDLVVQSLHKMLFFPTQLAVLHSTEELDEERMRKCISFFHSTSPSYLLMGAFSQSLEMLEKIPKEYYQQKKRELDEFYEALCQTVFYNDFFREKEKRLQKDPFKILLDTRKLSLSGEELEMLLREKYKIQVEAWDIRYVLALSSPFQKKQALDLLLNALLEINRDYSLQDSKEDISFLSTYYKDVPKRIYSMEESWDREMENIPIECSKGRVSGDFVLSYPPGIPILCPGEKIEEKQIQLLKKIRENGISIIGLQENHIKVIKR